MNHLKRFILMAVMAVLPAVATATDVDGPGDCGRPIRDFGDAPEGYPAYGGALVIGNFPTCLTFTGPGTQTSACAAPISTLPGPTGFVTHESLPDGYWLGCGAPLADDGVDSEPDGKTSPGGGPSACSGGPVDCLEAAFATSFGQDECYGDTDAGLRAPPAFTTCDPATITFDTFNCGPDRLVFLNVLVDWNHDGDWNDNGACPGGTCWFEWAVKNFVIAVPSGCATLTSPVFMAGDAPGDAWLRVTISDDPVLDDFPWNGSAGTPADVLRGGETEDYPVEVRPSPFDPCDDAYLDFGDAPEDLLAYPAGAVGHFPTCAFPSAPGTQNIICAPLSTPPGPTGAVIHEGAAGDAVRFWLGCMAAGPPSGLDSEADGKVNPSGVAGDPSFCDPAVPTDCVETVFGGSTFGQDECYGDTDAGVSVPLVFDGCAPGSVPFTTYNCGPDVDVFLNILVDMNEDGDWNDNFLCPLACAYEWAVKNVPIVLPSGCAGHVSPAFMVGPNAGNGWVRITLTAEPVLDDFPWNGSLGAIGGRFRGGETEDYPVTIRPPEEPCAMDYQDFGDAPEDLVAYPSGVLGHFPTCFAPTAPGNLTAACAPPLGTPPGPTGVVWHVGTAGDAVQAWLGCGVGPGPGGVDGEIDGKVEVSAVTGPSHCDPAETTDCVETLVGALQYGQDECYGDGVDAGIAARLEFRACSLATVPLRAYLCSPADVDVYLNILVDWNKDGDWNDNGTCLPTGVCVNEWAVKNATIPLVPGCNSFDSPVFPVGLRLGPSWMRVTVTLDPVPDDFPWNGSAGTPLGNFKGGETEDYPVHVVTSTIVGVDEPGLPGELDLAIQPNPSWDGTTVRFALPREGSVRLAIYDITGRRIRTLAGGSMSAGAHTVEWNYRTDDGDTAPVGVYLVRLEALGRVVTRAAIRIR